MASSPSSPKPARWQTRSGAIGIGSLAGLFIALVIATMLVAFVPANDDAGASPDDDGDSGDATTTPTEETGTPVPTDFTGTWITNFATAELMQQGTNVTGTYSRFLADNSPRTIQGAVTDRTLDGTFDGPNPIRFQMANDGQSFMGHWADPQGGLHEWCGSLGAPLPDGCGYSGEWRVKNFPPLADLDGDSILMSQNGDSVTMRFDSNRHGEVELDLTFDRATLAQANGSVELGNATLQFQFLVTEDPDWNTLRGTWRSGSASGQWCAAQADAALPC
jgi:hypothetical protein